MLYYAKSLQSCPTLCDPIHGSPPGSPVPGILQARTLEWAAISFSRGPAPENGSCWWLGQGDREEIPLNLSFQEESRREARSLLGTGAEGVSGPGSENEEAHGSQKSGGGGGEWD